MSFVIVRPSDFAENFFLKKYFLKILFAWFVLIILLEAPESTNTFNPKLGKVIKGSLAMLQIEFMSMTFPMHLEENFLGCHQSSYKTFDYKI